LQMILIKHRNAFVHNDPFDRIIIATAKLEEYITLTKDSTISKYDVKQFGESNSSALLSRMDNANILSMHNRQSLFLVHILAMMYF